MYRISLLKVALWLIGLAIFLIVKPLRDLMIVVIAPNGGPEDYLIYIGIAIIMIALIAVIIISAFKGSDPSNLLFPVIHALFLEETDKPKNDEE